MSQGKELKSFFLDIENGTVEVNGKEVKKVTALTLVFENGKYGLCITKDEFYSTSDREFPKRIPRIVQKVSKEIKNLEIEC